ncbi:hypothetical protein ECG_04495 [Echinococcus granulosus]|uniref:Expressed protein n=1 Tax=Echinococcus granulosus TaxID=6210 RepID=A0A068WFN2_ECHGR|nr:hypothetical protein ECG_04495 [Echinococcus granulosus]CDS17222.1 expressed protein [Echinococcus granulosus]
MTICASMGVKTIVDKNPTPFKMCNENPTRRIQVTRGNPIVSAPICLRQNSVCLGYTQGLRNKRFYLVQHHINQRIKPTQSHPHPSRKRRKRRSVIHKG